MFSVFDLFFSAAFFTIKCIPPNDGMIIPGAHSDSSFESDPSTGTIQTIL